MSTRNTLSNPQAQRIALALGLAGFLGLGGLAAAQPPQVVPGPPAFSTMDANGDGKVSADEFAQFRAQRMAARAAEGRLMRNAANAPTFESLDTDGDGYLTQAEVATAQQARFAARGGCGRGYGAGPGAGCGGGPGGAGRPCWRNQ